MRTIAWGMLAAGCSGGGSDKTGSTGDSHAAELRWYSTCGDPACSGYSGPFEGIAACTTEAEGDPCSSEGAQCDPVSDCNALMVCAEEDPKQQTGGCPISRAAHKRDITYLDAASRKEASDKALSMQLATWRYAWETGSDKEHLGFIIDDLGPAPADSPAVREGGQTVDLYGYTSLVLAAIQEQQAEIERLKAEVAALSESCAR